MKRAQDGAMEKAMLARKQHLEEMRDKIRAKVGSPSNLKPYTSQRSLVTQDTISI